MAAIKLSTSPADPHTAELSNVNGHRVVEDAFGCNQEITAICLSTISTLMNVELIPIIRSLYLEAQSSSIMKLSRKVAPVLAKSLSSPCLQSMKMAH